MIFTPINGASSKISATQTNSSTTLSTTGDPNVIRIRNVGVNTVFVRLGAGAQTAVVDTDLAVPAGDTLYLGYPEGADARMGAICNAGETSTLYVSPGYGAGH